MFIEIKDVAEVERELEHDSKGYPPPEQHGVVRWSEKEERCASRGCGSPTYLRLRRTPYCYIHLLRLLNEMLIEVGIAWNPDV